MTTDTLRPSVIIDSPAPHPRLYAGKAGFDRAGRIGADPWFKPFVESVNLAVDSFPDLAGFHVPNPKGHNAHLMRARFVQSRVCTLAYQAIATGESKYVSAAMDYIQMIHDWEYWSWITWRKNDNDPNAIYDLSYGENCATLAIVHDWLYDLLSEDQRALILKTAMRGVDSFMIHTTNPERPHCAWWYRHAESNWNTVCAGGAGMLALSFYESLPQAPVMLGRVEHSFAPYMENLVKLNGAWPEGIGYWNYGMRYAFMYLLSYENTTGKKHPLIEQPATTKSLYFPMDFCPSGVACSFGDVNHWNPLPFHFAVAERLGQTTLLASLKDAAHIPGPQTAARDQWPSTVEALLMIPENISPPEAPEKNIVKLYEGQDWGIIADKFPRPNVYAAVRGGTTEVPHGHHDLTSFHLVMGTQKVINSLGVPEYLDSTFSPRRYELYDTTPMSKNVILVNGLGITGKSTVVTKPVKPALNAMGFHVDASSAMGVMRDGPCVTTNQRWFLLVDGEAFIVVDLVEVPQFARIESRMHTPLEVTLDGDVAKLTSTDFACSLTLAGTAACALHKATALPTSIGAQTFTVIRWMGRELQHRVVYAAGFIKGDKPVGLKVSDENGSVSVEVTLPGKAAQVIKLV